MTKEEAKQWLIENVAQDAPEWAHYMTVDAIGVSRATGRTIEISPSGQSMVVGSSRVLPTRAPPEVAAHWKDLIIDLVALRVERARLEGYSDGYKDGLAECSGFQPRCDAMAAEAESGGEK